MSRENTQEREIEWIGRTFGSVKFNELESNITLATASVSILSENTERISDIKKESDANKEKLIATYTSLKKIKPDAMIHFYRGYLEGNMSLTFDKNNVMVSANHFDIVDIKNFFGIPCEEKDGSIIYHGTNAIDFLGTLYPIFNEESIYFTKYHQFFYKTPENFKFKYAFANPDAVAPTKNKPSDAGWDIILIRRIKENEDTKGVEYYTTGLIIQPPTGYHFEIVGRSSLPKFGYTVANNIGVADGGYLGEYIVALRKVWSNSPDLVLPARIAQIVPRKTHYMLGEKVDVKDLLPTARAEGGFGSSG